ncbi:MAG: AcrR family transcriptional regulator [Bradymonadia bacterium]|jgi:AcrR family transcriptional regulator
MARPANTSSEDTRQRILEHAIQEFAQYGFSAVSTRALASAASVNIGTLNYHFGSKQGVYSAAVALVYERIRARAAELAPEVLAAPDIHAQVGALVDFSRANRQSVRLLTREVLDHGGLSPETEAAHFLPSVEANTALLARAFGLQTQQARALLVSGGFLLARFVIQSDQSLSQALGVPVDGVRDAVVSIVHKFVVSQIVPSQLN